MDIGRRIKELRERRGWSQEQLAMQARRHISQGAASKNARLAAETISRIENGHRKPDPWVQNALALALGVSVGYLVEGASSGSGGSAEGQVSALPPPLTALAELLETLPEVRQVRLLAVCESLVALFSVDGLGALSERERLLLASYDQLPEEDQEAVLEVAERMLAAQRATGASSADARQAS